MHDEFRINAGVIAVLHGASWRPRPDAEGATVEDLRQQLAENPQAAVTFATTEHFNLQTERAATHGDGVNHRQAPGRLGS